MTTKNALGFLALGLLMHVAPVLVQAASDTSAQVADTSVRIIWVEFMSWVLGSIGLGYLVRVGMFHLPTLIATLVPGRFLRPSEAKAEALPLPAGQRIGVSN